ncbi:MAG: 23S rRNA (adenine(1618)-N(6))-methyltransferase RlmF [Marinobacterium sp.]|nr:23S rRNA (adenine(1618)-N(6))-methyltransferase RlmF [Marinobacterium sp.]
MAEKKRLHPRNPHQGRYDFDALIRTEPELADVVKVSPRGQQTINFSDALAVKLLNRALLMQHYGLRFWDIPQDFLCPPIPGRADHIHYIADLLADCNGGEVPCGKAVKALDIGTGANLIYPIIGSQSYGWQFTGADISKTALVSAQLLIDANPALRAQVSVRRQSQPQHIFTGIVRTNEQFSVSLCNPPFHASAADAAVGTQRKLRNLANHRQQRGKDRVQNPGGNIDSSHKADRLNFGGQHAELWCPGGEAAFVGRMIAQSRHYSEQFCWFTSLVSSSRNLPGLKKLLARTGAVDVEVLNMQQGQKQSRILAWTFLDSAQRRQWAQRWR